MFSCKVGLHEILLMSIYMFFVSRDNVSKSAQTFEICNKNVKHN